MINIQETMGYNSQKEILSLAAYGRNIQNLVDYCKTIEEKEKRQEVAERIVLLMLQMYPQSKNIAEYKEKLWNEFFIMADFDIDVLPPSGKIPTREIVNVKPDPLEYPSKSKRYRHYGNNVQKMIDKAMAMEDGDVKDGFKMTIGSFMKLAYKTWNSDHYVNDEVIKADFEKISEGKLVIEDDVALSALNNTSIPKINVRSNTGGKRRKHGSSKYSNNRGSNRNNNNRNRRR